MAFRKYIGKVLLILIIILIIGALLFWGKSTLRALVSEWIAIDDTLSAFPKNGTYYCEDLDAYLQFTDQGTHVLTYNDIDYIFVVQYDGLFHYLPSGKEDGVLFRSNYYWKKKADILYLRMDFFPGQFKKGVSYSFVRVK